MEYGYIRVLTKEQNEQGQLIAMREFGIAENRVYMDKQSGKDFERKNYKRLIRKSKKDDTLVVKSIDRLGRNYTEILEEWAYLTKTLNVAIVVLDMPLLDTRRERDLRCGTCTLAIYAKIIAFLCNSDDKPGTAQRRKHYWKCIISGSEKNCRHGA